MSKKGLRQRAKRGIRSVRSNKRTKLALIVIIIISFSVIAVFLMFPRAFILKSSSSGSMGMGDVSANMQMETKPLKLNSDGSYSVIQTGEDGDLQNAPFYIGEQEISAIEFVITISASGSYVDWSTLEIVLNAAANDLQVGTKNLPETALEKNAAGFSEIITFRITDLTEYIDENNPDDTDEDGTDYFHFDCVATATGYIIDAKGNELTDTVTIRHPWTLNTLPDGTFTIDSEEAIKPTYSSIPQDERITQGDPLTLTWIANDDNPATYVIKTYTPADGSSIVAQGEWTDGGAISWNKAGSYVSIEPGDIKLKVTCTVIDQDSQQTIDSVIIQITVPTSPEAPNFSKSDGPTSSATSGSVEIFITFKPYSANPSSYKIYMNGVLEDSGTWTGGDIIHRVTYLYSGTNTIKCVVTDSYGQSSSYTHTISTDTKEDPAADDDSDEPIINAPFSLGHVQGLSIFIATGFMGIGLVVFWIMRRKKKSR